MFVHSLGSTDTRQLVPIINNNRQVYEECDDYFSKILDDMYDHIEFVLKNGPPLHDRDLFVSIEDIWEAKPIQYESNLMHALNIDS